MKTYLSGAVDGSVLIDRLGIKGAEWKAAVSLDLVALRPGDRLIWVYFAPWSDLGALSGDEWVALNREALKAKAFLAERMLIVNGAAPISRLKGALERPGWVEAEPVHAVRSETQILTEQLFSCLVAFAAPTYAGIYEHLEATADAPMSESSRGIDVPLENEVYSFVRDIQRLLRAERDICSAVGGEGHAGNGTPLLEQFHSVQERAEEFFLRSKQTEKELSDVTAEAREQMTQLRIESDLVAASLNTQIRQATSKLDSMVVRLEESERGRNGAIAKVNDLEQKLVRANQELLSLAQPVYQSEVIDKWFALNRLRKIASLVPPLKRRYSSVAVQRERQRSLNIINRSGLMDRAWYLQMYPDVKLAGIDPSEHYLDFGWQERRDPGPGFDTSFYVMNYVDVARSGINPLLHFIEFGGEEGRLPREAGGPVVSV